MELRSDPLGDKTIIFETLLKCLYNKDFFTLISFLVIFQHEHTPTTHVPVCFIFQHPQIQVEC